MKKTRRSEPRGPKSASAAEPRSKVRRPKTSGKQTLAQALTAIAAMPKDFIAGGRGDAPPQKRRYL